MPRGGARAGAGRPRKAQPRGVTALRDFDLEDRMRRLAGQGRGLTGRCALVMAAFDVPLATMAMALELDAGQLEAEHRDQLAEGRAMKEANLISAIWAMARDGDGASIRWLLGRLMRQA